MDWFLYDRDLCHERIKTIAAKTVERVDHIHSILSCIMLKNAQTYFKNLAVLHRKIFKVCLAILQHYASNG